MIRMPLNTRDALGFAKSGASVRRGRRCDTPTEKRLSRAFAAFFLALAFGASALFLGRSALCEAPHAFAGEVENRVVLLSHVTDEAGVLASGQRAELEEQARRIEQEDGFGVYLVFVEDYRAYYDGSVSSAAAQLFSDYNLGVGEQKDGIVLLLSMESRDYALAAHGDKGSYAFDDTGCSYLAEFFLDDFSEDRWYEGSVDFLSWTENYLDAADKGKPYTVGNPPKDLPELITEAVFALGVPIAAAVALTYAVMAYLMRKMRSVEPAVEARSYAVGPVEVTAQADEFVRTAVSREPIERKNKASEAPSITRTGGFTGSSGKF